MSDSDTTIDAVRAFFDADGWPLTTTHDDSVLQTRFRGDSGEWSCFIEVSEQPSQLVFHSVAPVLIPEERRPVAAELVVRINEGLALGGFDLAYEAGEVRYRTSVMVDEGVLDTAMIRPATYLNVAMMDRYLTAIMLLASSQLDATAIIDLVAD